MTPEADGARRASPWARLVTTPLLLLAVWARVWIGDWAWVALVLVFLWITLSPTLLPPATRQDRWSARVAAGEALWQRRTGPSMSGRDRVVPLVWHITAGLALAVALIGALMAWLGLTLAGGAIASAARLFYWREMARLFRAYREAAG